MCELAGVQCRFNARHTAGLSKRPSLPARILWARGWAGRRHYGIQATEAHHPPRCPLVCCSSERCRPPPQMCTLQVCHRNLLTAAYAQSKMMNAAHIMPGDMMTLPILPACLHALFIRNMLTSLQRSAPSLHGPSDAFAYCSFSKQPRSALSISSTSTDCRISGCT